MVEIKKIVAKKDIEIKENRKTRYFYVIEGTKNTLFLAWDADEHFFYEIDKISINNIYYADKFTLDKKTAEIKLCSFYDKHADMGYGADIDVFALYSENKITFLTREEGEKEAIEELGVILEEDKCVKWKINEDLFV